MTSSVVYVVRYEGAFYLHYRTTETGQAMLINSEGKAIKNPVPVHNLRKVKKLKVQEVAGVQYVDTKLGVFKLATGRPSKSKAVLSKLRG